MHGCAIAILNCQNEQVQGTLLRNATSFQVLRQRLVYCAPCFETLPLSTAQRNAGGRGVIYCTETSLLAVRKWAAENDTAKGYPWGEATDAIAVELPKR